jgi:hypothetical protein
MPIDRKNRIRITLREGVAMLVLFVALAAYVLVGGGVAVYSLVAVFGPVAGAAAH